MAAGMVQVPYGDRLVSRIEPAMAPQAYKTYGMSMPLKTHTRPATCAEAECEHYTHGWASTFDVSTDLGQRQFAFCRTDRTRSYQLQRPGPDLVRLIYAPGNTCFRRDEHRVALDRPARFYVAGGDWRGNPMATPVRVHASAANWCEDFATHQDRIATAIERG